MYPDPRHQKDTLGTRLSSHAHLKIDDPLELTSCAYDCCVHLLTRHVPFYGHGKQLAHIIGTLGCMCHGQLAPRIRGVEFNHLLIHLRCEVTCKYSDRPGIPGVY